MMLRGRFVPASAMSQRELDNATRCCWQFAPGDVLTLNNGEAIAFHVNTFFIPESFVDDPEPDAVIEGKQ